MANIDQEFVEFVVKSLVGEPDKVEIKRSIDEKGVLLELTVAPDDLGRVIGKRGNTDQSIRTLLRALGTKNDARYNLKIVDPEGHERPQRRTDDNAAPAIDDGFGAAPAAAVAEPAQVTNDGASQWAHLSSTNDDAADDDTADSTDEDDKTNTEEPESSSVVEKTREELADLDSLDI